MTAGRLPGACGNESAQQLPGRDSLVAVEGAREHIEGAWGHVSAASPAIIPKPYTPVRHKAGASDDGVGCGAAGGADRQDGESLIDSRNPSETADLVPAKLLISSVRSPSGSAPDTEAEVTAAATRVIKAELTPVVKADIPAAAVVEAKVAAKVTAAAVAVVKAEVTAVAATSQPATEIWLRPQSQLG